MYPVVISEDHSSLQADSEDSDHRADTQADPSPQWTHLPILLVFSKCGLVINKPLKSPTNRQVWKKCVFLW